MHVQKLLELIFTTKKYYILIVAVESDTRKYHEFFAMYCYECAA